MQQQTKCSVHGHDCHEGLFARNLYLGQRIPLAGVAREVAAIPIITNMMPAVAEQIIHCSSALKCAPGCSAIARRARHPNA
jgi:hypothetical protein